MPYVVALRADPVLTDRVVGGLAPFFAAVPAAAEPAFSLEHQIGPVSIESEMLEIATNHRGNRIWRAGADSFIYAIGSELVRYDLARRGVSVRTERADLTAVQALKRAVYIRFIRHCRETGFRHLHAGAARCGAGGFVFLGDKGAGKTTTILTALDLGWDFISNDQVLIGPVADTCCALGLPMSVRLGADTSRLFPHRHLPDGESVLAISKVAEAFACGVAPDARLLGCVLLCRDSSTRPSIIRIDDHGSKSCLAQAHSIPLPSMHQLFWPKGDEFEAGVLGELPFFVARFADGDVRRMLSILQDMSSH